MTTTALRLPEPRILFSAPWEPVVSRRGDALGLRDFAESLSDAVAPQLTNRISDGRWITILAWCLTRSNDVSHVVAPGSTSAREAQERRYAWLRPLELMWVARTIHQAKNWRARPLNGMRRVRRWVQDDDQKPPTFGMTLDQYSRYRQTGMYGGYRRAFRKLDGLTVHGDGWTPGKTSIALATWLDGKLGLARPGWELGSDMETIDRFSSRSISRFVGREDKWWLEHWGEFLTASRGSDMNTLPRTRGEHSPLPEARLLQPLLFGGSQGAPGFHRSAVAQCLSHADVVSHSEACEALAAHFKGNTRIAALPVFSRLADAGMAVMRRITIALFTEPATPLSQVVGHPGMREACAELHDAAKAWRQSPHTALGRAESVNRFAERFMHRSPVETVRALLEHHEARGGGLRWFVLRDDRVEPRSFDLSGGSAYRFRLWNVCRLAVQCGVIPEMPAAFRHDAEADVEREDADEEPVS